jgi:SH3 domain protein
MNALWEAPLIIQLAQLPTRGNSETIAVMKTFGANRCLVIATVSLVTALLPLAGIAQEEATPSAEQVAPQESSQQRFVSDKLVLNVYAEPDQSSARVATIQTGDVVEELERAANMVRVRLEDGREGWVGASYLTSDAPAAARLRELQRQQKTETHGPDKESADQIVRLKKENAALKSQVTELQSRPTAPAAPAIEAAQIIPTSTAEVVNEETELAGAAPVGGAWLGWLIAVMLTGALGFASGYQMLARRLRKRFGALKIY